MKITRIKGGGVVRMDIDRMGLIQAAFSSGMHTQVGILGSKAAERHAAGSVRKEGGHSIDKRMTADTNAEIGLIHEKGSYSQHIPRRSFLMDTFTVKAEGLLAIKRKLWMVFVAGDQTRSALKRAYRDLGILAERMIDAAFQTKGFGRWADIKQSTKDRKKSSGILIDTGQLRRSISSRVVGG